MNRSEKRTIFIIAVVILLIGLFVIVSQSDARQTRWAIGIAKTTERAHAAAERTVESDEEIVGYQAPVCHHSRYANGRVNYEDVRCPVPMRVEGGGFRDYTFRRWSTRNASGNVVTWESFYPTPAYATGFIPTPPRSQGH